MDTPRVALIKNIYLYLVSFVALMMVVISLGDIINIALRTYIFTKADLNYYYSAPCVPMPPEPGTTTIKGEPAPCVTTPDQRKQNDENIAAQRQRDLVRDISFLIVGLPLFAYHWHLARKKE